VSPATAERDPQALVDKAIADNRLAHALLIHAQSFKFIESFAFGLAAKLMDIESGEDQDERLLRHPDLFALRPSKKSRIISVDDTRELIRKIQHSPQAGDRKVALVFEADCFNASAANAFLKTLEEPPLNTTILLLTSRPHSLLATIRSRCQLFRLPSPSVYIEDDRALSWLDQYESWLSDLVEGKPGGKKSVPRYIVGAYGLLEQFRHIIAAIAKETWKEHSKKLPEGLEDDERIALESRISISIRQEFLAAIEAATETFARQTLAARQDAATKLTESIRILEQATSLLRLNMKAETMLEIYLLQALRIWSAK